MNALKDRLVQYDGFGFRKETTIGMEVDVEPDRPEPVEHTSRGNDVSAADVCLDSERPADQRVVAPMDGDAGDETKHAGSPSDAKKDEAKAQDPCGPVGLLAEKPLAKDSDEILDCQVYFESLSTSELREECSALDVDCRGPRTKLLARLMTFCRNGG